MNDEQLRARLAALDPMPERAPADPIDSARARSLLENIVNTTLEPEPTERSPETSSASPSRPPRRRWLAPALAVAAVAVVAVGGAAVAGVFDGGDPEPTIMALSTGDVDPSMMSCLAPDPTTIAQSPVAFRATVDAVEGEQVTMTVDTWYAGGDADIVELIAPSGMEGLIGGLAFVPGEAYLVSAYDGVVSYCGLTGPATPELQAMYDAAFPG